MNLRQRYRVEPGDRTALQTIDPGDKGGYAGRVDVADAIEANRNRLAGLQTRLYAERRRAVLICLQGMDAAGKDGVVNHILGALNPLGCTVTSFGVPSTEEQAHDFMWRYHKAAPARGWIGIFNRTHYESVLVERVHGLVQKPVWTARYGNINDFESMLADNGTTLIKLMLHISNEEQLSRFKDRLDNPLKRWKISEADYSERRLWDAYAEAYGEALAKTSTKIAPWYVVPANHKWFRDLVVSRIVADRLEDLDIADPKPRVDLAEMRRKYHAAKRNSK